MHVLYNTYTVHTKKRIENRIISHTKIILEVSLRAVIAQHESHHCGHNCSLQSYSIYRHQIHRQADDTVCCLCVQSFDIVESLLTPEPADAGNGDQLACEHSFDQTQTTNSEPISLAWLLYTV